MTASPRRILPRHLLGRLRRDERGSSLVEYALTIALFLFFFFALLDFGRLMYQWVMAEKAMQMAARLAAVRPAVCSTVPEINERGDGSTAADRFGSECDGRSNMCAGEAAEPITCGGADTGVSATAATIYARVADLLPPNAEPENLRFSYGFDPAMNFLGGPYTPVVTVELQDLNFEFVSPLFGLLRASGVNIAGGNEPGNISFPSMSVSLPGEDLALGENG